MNQCGVSFVVGRPLDGPLSGWALGAGALDGLGVLRKSVRSLHATLGAAGLPSGRSVATAQEAMQSAHALRRKLGRLIEDFFPGVVPFEVPLAAPRVAGPVIVVPSLPDRRLLQIKAKLQGNSRAIPEDRAAQALIGDACLAIDKYSSMFPAAGGELQPSVSITLGDVGSHDVARVAKMLAELPPAPSLIVPGVRVAVYRDRRLEDADVSGVLRFGASREELEAVVCEFFDSVAALG